MSYAIDLNERQSARTLEQAVRHQATVLLEPRIWPLGETIRCRMESCERPEPDSRRIYSTPLVLVTCPDTGSDLVVPEGLSARDAAFRAVERFSALIGTYCDATLELGENRYLFSSDVTRVDPAAPGSPEARICMSRPEIIQVAQRRRFRRIQLPQAAQVEIRWRGDGGMSGAGMGWLYNIGQDGIACRTDTLLADRLCIGQEVVLDFALRPGDPEHFILDAVICNKTPAGTPDRTILGMQFLAGTGREASTKVREALRRRLRVLTTAPVSVRKGADA